MPHKQGGLGRDPVSACIVLTERVNCGHLRVECAIVGYLGKETGYSLGPLIVKYSG